LVRGVIVPRRYRQSAQAYEKIWTDVGSPLMLYSNKVLKALRMEMGENACIELAMRYQEPSIEKALKNLQEEQVDKLLILPLFPQYASATTGSVHQKVMSYIKNWQVLPELIFINQYATNPNYIEAICSIARTMKIKDYDHFLFSFHGLPERQLCKADRQNWCLKQPNCCASFQNANKNCYAAQCYATASKVAEGLNINPIDYTVCFQSRLGKEPWLEPYTSDVLNQSVKKGRKKLLVFSPSFVCDCLETIYEIQVEYKQEFLHAGGTDLDLVPGLNDHPLWINTLKEMILDHLKRNERTLCAQASK
jgi:ferrochelatase